MLKVVALGLLFIHGLIHLLGFVQAFFPGTSGNIQQPISKPMGLLWLVAALLLIGAGISLILHKAYWLPLLAIAILLSQFLVFRYWPSAKFGSLLNSSLLLVLVLGYGRSRFDTMVEKDKNALVGNVHKGSMMVQQSDLDSLPPIVGAWLIRSGIMGKRLSFAVSIEQVGRMRTKPDGKWMDFKASQVFRVDQPGFVWSVWVNAPWGLWLQGRDMLKEGKGEMLIKALSIQKVADAHGAETDQGSLMRYLAEMVWIPQSAILPYIKWEAVNDTTARAILTTDGHTVTGDFQFSREGDFLSFRGKRYYSRDNGATLEDWLVEVSPDGYREFNGLRLPAVCQVSWLLKEGKFHWLSLEVTDHLQITNLSKQ
ncbi:hypothetical protein KJS94_00055 [Flavihumibacter rivuli]|uniref:DUF6544 family protein n=1 Tax=Flavihumibacter rivuli TaxID=2838156 RepID=UPI001BDDD89A|nr:DUF6544 family protein [Flavihumibacter rivuli]ULQ56594.1 hypothetical protein KJS94_00055 [Flavihumibacter rivuli]